MGNEGFGGAGNYDFSQKLLAALPADPFEQLEVAQKITSMAVVAGVNKLEAETGRLRQRLGEKEDTIHSMQQRINDLERTLQDTSFRLSQALDDQEKVTNEKNVLATLVQKLKREISKLEMFKKNLLQSLQEDEDTASQIEDIEILSQPTYVNSTTFTKVDDRGGSIIPRPSDHADMYGSVLSTAASDLAAHHPDDDDDDQRGSIASGLPMTPSASRGSGSTFRRSSAGTAEPKASRSPTHRTTHHSMPSISGQTPRVDGKEFFRQARNRLSYQQFSAFLSNIKELNSHRQSREETLTKVEQIFGPDNQDLFYAFVFLI